MTFWEKIEQRFFTGEIVKDYGVIYKHNPFPWWTTEYQVFLTEKNGAKRVVIKQKSGAKGERNVSYHEFDLPAAKCLKDVLDQIVSVNS